MLTWLQAAEHVLREEGPEMHIRDLTNRILEQGIVKSNCATSLETLLYRHTSGSGNAAVGRGRAGSSYTSGGSAGAASGGGGQSFQTSKFVRVPGKHGWFGLRDPHSLPSMPVGVACVVEPEDRILMDTTPSNEAIVNDGDLVQNGMEQVFSFEPRAFYSANVLSQQYSRKRRHSYHSSGGESVSSLSGGSEDELGVMGEMNGEESSEFTSDEDSGADDALYRKKYQFMKRMAKNMIHVC